MKIQINNEALAETLGYKKDEIVEVKDKNGIPLRKEWRNRIKDSVLDNCVTVISETEKKGAKK